MNPQLKLVIFAHARSGSSSLYRLLQLHPDLHIAEEPFHEGFSTWYPGEKNYIDHITDITSMEEQLAELFTKYNGIKILQYQLDPALYTHLLLKPELRIIFLRRRNLLRAAVSGRIAEQTGAWKVWDLHESIAERYQKLQPLAIPRLREIIQGECTSMDMYESIVDQRAPGSYIKLWHENLYTPAVEHNRSVLQGVFDLLGLTLPSTAEIDRLLDPAITKLNSDESYRFVPNIDEVEAHLGSDETGWLFEKALSPQIV